MDRIGGKLTQMTDPTPTNDAGLPRRFADFDTLVDAIEYAAKGVRGFNFYSSRGELEHAITFRELRDKARMIGRKLAGMGFVKGDRVALIAETTPDFVAFFLGAQYASVLPVPLPLPTSFGGREGFVRQLNRQLTSCEARAIVTPDEMRDYVKEAAEELKADFIGPLDAFMDWADKEDEPRLPGTDDISYLQYSSGSTRFPHGIAISHKSLLSNTRGIGEHGMQLRDDDRGVSWLPFYHDMGLVGMLLVPLTCQVSTDYLATEDFARRPLQWLSLMSKNHGTISYSPTFGYDICARRAGSEAISSLDLASWRVAGIGGDMIRPKVMENFAETFAPAGLDPKIFCASYGLAECTLAVSFMPLETGIVTDSVDEHILTGGAPADARTRINGRMVNGVEMGFAAHQRKVVNCGVPLPEYEIEVRNTDGDALGERAVGRVYVRGTSVMTGYFRDEEATRAVLSRDGWLDTGDMGYMLDGSLYIVGRAKDMIIVNGRNHWPQDIEWAAEQMDGLRSGDIAAISVPGESNEEVPAVLVQCRLRDEGERRDFAKQVRQHILKETGIHCQVELIPPRSLPRTSSGKLSRAKARAEFLSGGIQALAH